MCAFRTPWATDEGNFGGGHLNQGYVSYSEKVAARAQRRAHKMGMDMQGGGGGGGAGGGGWTDVTADQFARAERKWRASKGQGSRRYYAREALAPLSNNTFGAPRHQRDDHQKHPRHRHSSTSEGSDSFSSSLLDSRLYTGNQCVGGCALPSGAQGLPVRLDRAGAPLPSLRAQSADNNVRGISGANHRGEGGGGWEAGQQRAVTAEELAQEARPVPSVHGDEQLARRRRRRDSRRHQHRARRRTLGDEPEGGAAPRHHPAVAAAAPGAARLGRPIVPRLDLTRLGKFQIGHEEEAKKKHEEYEYTESAPLYIPTTEAAAGAHTQWHDATEYSFDEFSPITANG
jgi:hypothetical protein